MNLLIIAPDFEFLNDQGFTVTESSHDPKAFGNAHVLASNGKISFRFIRDRGQTFVDVGFSGNWVKLEDVLEFVDPSARAGIGDPPRLQELAGFTRHYWQEFERVLSSSAERERLIQFSNRKASEFVEGIFGAL